MIRPVGHYLVILSIFVLILSQFTLLEKVKGSVVLFLGWFSMVLWWLLRNYLLTGFIFFHTLPGIHFLIYSASYVDMELNKCSYNDSKRKLMNITDK